jgi:hypothetical protein
MRLVIGTIILAFVLGCQSKESHQAVVARVGAYVITQDEFEEAYKNSAYGRENNPFYRSTFLNNMINQKLILLDAEHRGLDRDPQFLKMVENFWQQSLLTIALQEKTKEGGSLDSWVDYLKKRNKVEINQEYLK